MPALLFECLTISMANLEWNLSGFRRSCTEKLGLFWEGEAPAEPLD